MVAIGFSSLKRSVALSAILCGALAGCASTQQSSKAELSPAQTNVPHPTAVATASPPTSTAMPGTSTTTTVLVSTTSTQPHGETTALSKTGRISPAGTQTAQLQQGQIQPGQIQSAQDRMGQPVTAQPQVAAANQGQVAIASVTGGTATNTSASAAYAASDEPPIPSVVAIPIPNPARPGEAASMQAVAADEPSVQSPIPLTPEMVAIQSVIPTPRPGGSSALPVTELAYAAPAPQAGFADSRPHYDYNFDTSGPTVIPAVLSEDNNDDNVSPSEKSYISRLIEKYAKIYEVPESLIHRVVHRESRYNPKAYNRAGYFGLMQIKYNTARSMGYQGSPTGLFDAETNIKYAAKYLRGAWMVADNKSEADAVALYARGYYNDAKSKGMMHVAKGDY
jgi:soluble lytic murein transglycosylase-like protein